MRVIKTKYQQRQTQYRDSDLYLGLLNYKPQQIDYPGKYFIKQKQKFHVISNIKAEPQRIMGHTGDRKSQRNPKSFMTYSQSYKNLNDSILRYMLSMFVFTLRDRGHKQWHYST